MSIIAGDYQTSIEDIQSQYRDTNISTFLKGVSDIKERYISKAIDSLYNDNLNITTAIGDGQNAWGMLLHFYRYIPADGSTDAGVNYFNFNDKNFVRLAFYNPNAQEYAELTDEAYRKFLLLLYQGMFIQGTIPNMNEFMNSLFSDIGNISVRDSHDMSYQTFVFLNGNLPTWLTFVLDNYDILPRPAGVGSRYIDATAFRRFGFAPEGTTDQWYFDNIGAFGSTNFAEI